MVDVAHQFEQVSSELYRPHAARIAQTGHASNLTVVDERWLARSATFQAYPNAGGKTIATNAAHTA
jgi:hypothetical protein